MKNILSVAMLVVATSLGFNVHAADEMFAGATVSSAQSTQNGASNTSWGLTFIGSKRVNPYYGIELEAGFIGKSGPFDQNAFVDLSVAGFLPLGSDNFRLYVKGGVADVFSTISNSNLAANNLGVTYGGGLEYQINKAAFRLGIQHYNVGDDKLSPSLSTNLIGITVMVSD